MDSKYRLISCMGCEKLFGQITTACSLLLEKNQEELNLIFKPSLAQIAADKSTESEHELDIIALNGCMSQCVNAILSNKGLKASHILNMPKILKAFQIPEGIKYTPDLLENQNIINITSGIEKAIVAFYEKADSTTETTETYDFTPDYSDTLEFTYSKFHFSVPVSKGRLYFNWNDAWAYDIGNGKVVIGITDYLQKNLSDISWCEFLALNTEIGQFEEIATLESYKTVVEVLSPFSGKLIQVNKKLETNPELINDDPHGEGWIAILETNNFSEEKEDLMESEQYFEFMKEKIEEQGVH